MRGLNQYTIEIAGETYETNEIRGKPSLVKGRKIYQCLQCEDEINPGYALRTSVGRYHLSCAISDFDKSILEKIEKERYDKIINSGNHGWHEFELEIAGKTYQTGMIRGEPKIVKSRKEYICNLCEDIILASVYLVRTSAAKYHLKCAFKDFGEDNINLLIEEIRKDRGDVEVKSQDTDDAKIDEDVNDDKIDEEFDEDANDDKIDDKIDEDVNDDKTEEEFDAYANDDKIDEDANDDKIDDKIDEDVNDDKTEEEFDAYANDARIDADKNELETEIESQDEKPYTDADIALLGELGFTEAQQVRLRCNSEELRRVIKNSIEAEEVSSVLNNGVVELKDAESLDNAETAETEEMESLTEGNVRTFFDEMSDKLDDLSQEEPETDSSETVVEVDGEEFLIETVKGKMTQFDEEEDVTFLDEDNIDAVN